MRSQYTQIRIFLLFVTTLVTDQISKYYIQTTHPQKITLNTGFAFGTSFSFLSPMVLILFLCILYILGKKIWNAHTHLASIFFAASISNILDRLFFGGVRDFLPIPFVSIRNNIADWIIVVSLVGIIMLEAQTLHIFQKK